VHSKKRSVEVFDRDAGAYKGYLYTDTTRLSCRMATQRTTDLILETGEIGGRSVLDVACGDGFYTVRFWDCGSPASLVAADAAQAAVQVAARNSDSRPIRFLVADAHHLPFVDDSFDVVLLQSVLHHDDDPLHMIREAFRIAPRVIIHEPNGNSPGLKIIEKISRYHREHGEKSYSSRQVKRWISRAGGDVAYERTAGFVAMFCPNWLARIMKFFEPAVECLPGVRAVACAVYVMVGSRE
jgi:SAM-dependent methyltransferase